LQMRHSDLSAYQRRRPHTTWSIGVYPMDDDAVNSTFSDLLSKYCHSNPISKPRTADGAATQAPSVDTTAQLKSQNLSYYSLSYLLNVKIEWRTSVCEHLEFNIRNKTLKLFRVPSYCVLQCYWEPGEPSRTFVDR
jgi:hypothetical protein